MSNDFPRMLYKAGGPHEIHGGKFDYVVVESEADQESALAEGWHMSTADAAGARQEATHGGGKSDGDNAPPTRAELESKAAGLGIGFDKRTTDAKLAAKIAAHLKA